MRWRWVIRTVAVIGLIVVGIPVLLFSYVLLRYSDSKADVRRVIDSLTPEDKALPPGASRIFRVPLWRGNRDAIVNRMIIYKIHPNAMSQSAWHMRSLCALMVMPWRATEEERNALMWRELYFGYEGYGLRFAAQTYFKKTLTELTDEEVVQLWTLAKSPNRFISKPRDFERASTVDLNRWRAEAK